MRTLSLALVGLLVAACGEPCSEAKVVELLITSDTEKPDLVSNVVAVLDGNEVDIPCDVNAFCIQEGNTFEWTCSCSGPVGNPAGINQIELSYAGEDFVVDELTTENTECGGQRRIGVFDLDAG